MQHIDFQHPYFGAFFMLVLATVIFFAVVAISRCIGNKLSRQNDERTKLSIYECGVGVPKQPNKISTHFYLFALLFILFDVEIIFMFPWAVNFEYLGIFGFIEMVLFIFLLGVGFIYAWNKGALEWQSIN